MIKIFKILVPIIALTLVMALPLGCRNRDELKKVRLNEVTHSVFYAPLYAAINLGFFEDEGIELELTTGQGADKVMTALLSGQADIGLMGPETTIYVYNQGQEDFVEILLNSHNVTDLFWWRGHRIPLLPGIKSGALRSSEAGKAACR